MKKALLIFVVVAGIVVAVFVFKKKPAIAPGPTESPTATLSVSPSPTISASDNVSPTVTPTASPTAIPLSQTATITFANGIVTPSIVTIKTGNTVKFVNNDSIPHWPASGIHPTHQICPGFDALRGLNNGESYSFKFNEAKTCPWHDHLKPSINGQIIVNQ